MTLDASCAAGPLAVALSTVPAYSDWLPVAKFPGARLGPTDSKLENEDERIIYLAAGVANDEQGGPRCS